VDIACDDLAARQYGDYRRGTPGTWFAEDHPPLSLEQAYAVQTEVARLRARDGSAVAGYKLGCIGARVREQFGMDGPIRGFLYADELHRSGAAISCARHANLAIEGEMAVRLGEDGAIAAAFPIVELHNYVYRGPKPTLAELIANNGLNAGVVLPDKEPALAEAGPLDATELEITLNGTLLERGPLWSFGSPEATLRWLRDHLGRHGLALQPGQLILAGTALRLHPVRPGDRLEVSAGAFGSVRMTVVD
jgi:2-keto-4-pentenoate hydratase